MCGVATEQVTTALELCSDLAFYGMRVVKVDTLIPASPRSIAANPFPQVDVQADAEPGPAAGICGGARRRRPRHHQTGAGDDAALVRLDDSARDARALSEIVGVDHERAFEHVGSRVGRSETKSCRELDAKGVERAVRLSKQRRSHHAVEIGEVDVVRQVLGTGAEDVL